MNRSLLLSLLALTVVSVSAQDRSEPPPPPLQYREFPHLKITNGRQNPLAIPIYEVTLTMLASYGSDVDNGSPSAVERFAQVFNVDYALAENLLQTTRELQSELDATNLARTKDFCATSFPSQDEWLAAVTVFDAESLIDRVTAFSSLRDIAGPEAWKNVLFKAREVARSSTMVQEDVAGVAADIGFELAFSNQCKDISEKRQ